MRKVPYSSLNLMEPGLAGTGKSSVYLCENPVPNCPDALRHALATMRLAAFFGVRPPSSESDPLPYSAGADNLVFPAPLMSLLCGRRIFLLRGWKRYESCVKGFSALGLLAEHAAMENRKLQRLSSTGLREAKLEFLASRRLQGEPGRNAFSESELACLPEAELDRIDGSCLALWRAFARRTIVCSTSSNMGICLHQALRDMQGKELSVAGKRFTLLNQNEGELVIWCPDEKADFMSPEKTAFLRSLEAEKPKLTSLRAYVNRQQRDPGALKEALDSGGYFYPTNPQSRSELQNLLTIALRDIEIERDVPLEELLIDPNIQIALESLGAEIIDDRVAVRSAVEGGMLGMAAPYLILLEEALLRGDARAVCVWNPASIGAALAALALCDVRLQSGPDSLQSLEPDLSEFFPNLGAMLGRGIGRGIHSRIHGVFDIANLQSLAQLFGVTIRHHFSGRATAYVGLGSSSYANGNLCFEILRDSAEKNRAFRGRDHLHPATHCLNPVAQALVYAEDVNRVARLPAFAAKEFHDKVRSIQAHCRKPEPAGAAALAGYLLARLDAGTLSFIELAYVLRAAGFTKATFLEFGGFGRDDSAADRYIQRSGEEGARMESLARGVLRALDWEWTALREAAEAERNRSRLEYRWSSLDDDAFEAGNPAVHINLTGDNCVQPSPGLIADILRSYERTKSVFKDELVEDMARQAEPRGFDAVAAVKRVAGALSRMLGRTQKGLDSLVSDAIRPVVDRMTPGHGEGSARRRMPPRDSI